MFSSLSDKLVSIINKIGNRGVLTESVINSTIQEIRNALIDADVALSVVKDFSTKLKEKLLGKKVSNNISPEQAVIKTVYDELVTILGGSETVNNIKRGKILMVGLQGTGKTTTSAKLAYLYKNTIKRKVLLVSLDTYRPAAIEQLRILAKNNSIDFFDDFSSNDNPIDIAKKASKICNKYDVVIYDTAGRLYIDDKMMKEVAELKGIIEPDETFLVIDSMMGQDAVNTAKEFNEVVSVSGIILTRMDGDSKGGAALSAKYVTNCKIKYACNGEKITDIEQFYPERIASRMLDQGDILSLLEKAKAIDEDLSKVSKNKKFDLDSMVQYLEQLEKFGGLGGFMNLIPRVKKVKEAIKNANINDKVIARQIAIVRSMTKEERREPSILNASRRRRIAKGCAQEVSDVNRLIKQYEMIKTLMSKPNSFFRGIQMR